MTFHEAVLRCRSSPAAAPPVWRSPARSPTRWERSARIAVVDRARIRGAGGRPATRRAFGAVGRLKRHARRCSASGRRSPKHAQPVTAIDITDSSLDDAIRPVLVSYDNTRGSGEEPATYIVENERLHAGSARARLPRRRPSLSWWAAADDSFAADEHGSTSSIRLVARQLRATLLVGGRWRATRVCATTAGIKVVRWSYPQTGIVTTVRPRASRTRAARVQHFLPAGPVRHPAADRQPLLHHLDGGGERGRARSLALDDAGFLRRGRQALRLSAGRHRAGRRARRLAARHASRPRHGRRSLCARRRCGARRASDRRPGSQPRPARRRPR